MTKAGYPALIILRSPSLAGFSLDFIATLGKNFSKHSHQEIYTVEGKTTENFCIEQCESLTA